MPCPSKKTMRNPFYTASMKWRRIRALGYIMQHALLSFVFEWRSKLRAIITLITVKLLSSRELASKIARSEVSSQRFPLTSACTLLKPWNKSEKTTFNEDWQINMYANTIYENLSVCFILYTFCDLINVRIVFCGTTLPTSGHHYYTSSEKNISIAFFFFR